MSVQTGRATPRRAGDGSATPAAGRGAASPGEFTLDDFRKQFEQIAKLGMKDVLARMPGMADMIPEGEDPEAALRRVQGMVDSMTPGERANPAVIDRSRRRRIAAGAGVQPNEVEQFLRQFGQVRALMRQMASMSLWERIKLVVGFGRPF